MDQAVNMKIQIKFLLIVFIGFSSSLALDDPILYSLATEYDICNPNPEVTNPSSIYINSTTEIFFNWTNSPRPADTLCSLYIKTCIQCYIKVESVGKFNYSSCSRNFVNDYEYDESDRDNECTSGCANINLYDVSYKNQTYKKVFQSNDTYMYKTQSHQIYITACSSNYNQNVAMRLRLTSMEKIELVKQTSPVPISGLYINSPFFPSPYAKNGELYTYIIQAETEYQVITLTFDDWLLTYSSYLEFQGANIKKVTGSYIRPYVISYGQFMTVKFYTGDVTSSSSSYLGFRARVDFQIKTDVTITQPIMDCDRKITSDGGTISMSTPDGFYRDCIWIIKRMSEFTGVILKVIKYQQDYRYTYSDSTDQSLVIHDGLTSTSDVILNARPNQLSINSSSYLSTSGFYIRVKGVYRDNESIVISYAMFVYSCLSYRGYFKCDNGLCIPDSRKCDGTDHCGDNSDESNTVCVYETTHVVSSNSISIGVIIPLVVSVFLIIIMCLLIIFIRRCRRMNNLANNNRPQAVRPPQSRGRRRRRQRDVQMSVTLSSGEHPPSYDEVLQNTPIGYLNMAFTWSQHSATLSQPPSYEEAISPTSPQPNGSIIITASASSVDLSTNQQQQNSSSVLAATISASLDPRADVSSSSSSEGAIDRYNNLDISSSSDSSTENEHPRLSNNNNLNLSRSQTNLNRAIKDLDNGLSSHNSPKNGSDNNSMQVVLKSPSSEKLDAEKNGSNKSEARRREDSRSNKSYNVMNNNQQNDGETRDRHREYWNVRDGNVSQNVHFTKRRQENRRNNSENNEVSRRESVEDYGIDRRDARERHKAHRKGRGYRSDHTSVREENMQQSDQDNYRKHDDGGMNKWPSNSSRSQSCFDLSWVDGAKGGSGQARLRDEDKRFSYAGAGDVSLQRGNFANFYNNRGLVREQPNEHLDKYASQSTDYLRLSYPSQSTDNIREGYRTRGHEHQNYETDEIHGLSNGNSTSENAAQYSRNKRDKFDTLEPDRRYFSLATVVENFNDDSDSSKFPDNGLKYKHQHTQGTVNKFNEYSTANHNPRENSNLRNSSRFRSEPNLMPSNINRLASGHDETNFNNRHLHSEFVGSQPFDGAFAGQSHQTYQKDDHRNLNQSQNFKRNYYNKHNFETKSDNFSSNAEVGVTKFLNQSQNPTQFFRNSRDFENFGKHNISNTNKERETNAIKPKPTQRTQIQASKLLNNETRQDIPQSTDHPHSQTKQKPTPAPRQGVKKRFEQDGVNAEFVSTTNQNYTPDNGSNAGAISLRSNSASRYSEQATAQQMHVPDRSNPRPQQSLEPYSNENQRSDRRREQRHESYSQNSSEHSTPRDQVQVQNTSDDVFV